MIGGISMVFATNRSLPYGVRVAYGPGGRAHAPFLLPRFASARLLSIHWPLVRSH